MRRTWLVGAAIAIAAVAIAWQIRFGTDDAYISFVYARSLVEGHGLTWFGTHIEGYTNFAWVLWIAAGLEAGIDPLVCSWIGSLAALAVAVVATHQLVRSRFGPIAAACAAGLLATNFTFLAFGTSGLETMAQTALLAVATWQVDRIRRDGPTPRRLAALSVIAALAIATRLDSAVICSVLAIAIAAPLIRGRAGARLWLAAIAPSAILLGAWLGWKLAYYGDILPNTFHAKVQTSGLSLAHGAAFVAAFLHAYLLWVALLGAAVIAFVRRRFESRLPAAIAVAWLAYVIAVGGDFMEFRFFVPVLPALYTIVAEAVTAEPTKLRLPSARLRALATVAALATVSWRHAASFQGLADDKSYDSVQALATFYGLLPDQDWARLGRPLNTVLAGTGASLACNGAGAIPYYADLPTVDQLGLNDAWIARHGAQPPMELYPRPGHQRYAPYNYLVERKVTFVIGSPMVLRRGDLATPPTAVEAADWLYSFLGPAVQPVPRFLLVAAPISDETELVMWYLTPSPEITAKIQAAGWEFLEVKPPPLRRRTPVQD